ncbi:hypothetical protein Tsubulata_039695 [Turnera subulata]|uniref:Uncharacterized protein n=1 Tax=Turnera subulata TaxID=218843 RepID=A0A9Q0IZB3_9ROSI|nr:hypothetical protein Tsubulata_039695 [Turnera subulata]
MAQLANLNGLTEALPIRPKLNNITKAPKRAKILGFLGKKQDHVQENPLQVSRRLALALSSIALIGISGNGVALAKDNGLWIEDFPLPVPSADNNLDNEKTGTRNFLKKRIYVANIPVQTRRRRIKKYAFDLMAMEDLIGPDTLNWVQRFLTLKTTFLYFDFDKIITAAPVDEKQPLLDLANRLFDNVEKVYDASRRKNFADTESSYADTRVILREVMDRMA